MFFFFFLLGFCILQLSITERTVQHQESYRMDANNDNATEEDLILKLSKEKITVMIPALIYNILLMLLGSLGNLMVFYYFQFRARVNTYTIFISVLSVYDLTVCVLVVPLEIYRMHHYYTFENANACKVLRFFNYFASVGSVVTLIIIASDRYRRICRWSSKQMSIRLAKICSAITTLVALVLSWPAMILYRSEEISIPNNYGKELKGLLCTGALEEAYKPYVSAFFASMFVLLIICSVVLTILYCAIGRKIYRQKIKLAKHKCNTLPLAKQIKEPKNDNSAEVFTIVESTESSTKSTTEKSSPATDTDNNRRITWMLVTITVLFLVSYVPLFAMSIWKIKVGKHQSQFLSGASLVAFEVAFTSFLFSSAVNPWVYGLFCVDFRRFFTERLASLSEKSISTSVNSLSNTRN